jgi:hypothetical protein
MSTLTRVLTQKRVHSNFRVVAPALRDIRNNSVSEPLIQFFFDQPFDLCGVNMYSSMYLCVKRVIKLSGYSVVGVRFDG